MNPETTFLSAKPCRLGHVPTYRYNANRGCVQCSLMQAEEWAKSNSKKRLETNNKWKDKNRERVRTYCRERGRRVSGLPTPTRPAPAACECCGKSQSRALCLDHDHETGAFRGWLCISCNRGMGYLGDTVDGLRRAIRYLEGTEDAT